MTASCFVELKIGLFVFGGDGNQGLAMELKELLPSEGGGGGILVTGYVTIWTYY